MTDNVPCPKCGETLTRVTITSGKMSKSGSGRYPSEIYCYICKDFIKLASLS